MTLSELRRPICAVFWAHVLIYISLNLGTLNVLPPWAGYLMLFSLLATLGAEQPTLKLLRPFALGLAANAAYAWLRQLLGGDLPALPGWLTLAIGLVTMYFHFQLFTDLADLVQRRGTGAAADEIKPLRSGAQGTSAACKTGGLLTARTIQVLLHTVLLIDPLMTWLQSRTVIWFITLAIYLVVLFIILYQLYALRRWFPTSQASP
jgi:hypothetical protein